MDDNTTFNDNVAQNNVNDSGFSTQPVNGGLVGLDSSTPIPEPAPAISQPEQQNSDGSLLVDHSDGSINNELITLREKALNDLSPIVKNLQQTPEEKFHTTMMMIQASDDKSLLPEAYESAQNITDDKERAQALLDVINEINYFTHKKKQELDL